MTTQYVDIKESMTKTFLLISNASYTHHTHSFLDIHPHDVPSYKIHLSFWLQNATIQRKPNLK